MEIELRKIIAVENIPTTLRQYAEELLARSRKVIPSLGKHEVARSYLCAHVAAVEKALSLSLPGPEPRQMPLRVQDYSGLFKEFQEKLGRREKPDSRSRAVVAAVCAQMHVSAQHMWERVRSDELDWDLLGAVLYAVRFGREQGDGVEQSAFLARFLRIAGKRARLEQILLRLPEVRQDYEFMRRLGEAKAVVKRRRHGGYAGRMRARVVLTDSRREEVRRWTERMRKLNSA